MNALTNALTRTLSILDIATAARERHDLTGSETACLITALERRQDMTGLEAFAERMSGALLLARRH